jgi:hypothetical protein
VQDDARVAVSVRETLLGTTLDATDLEFALVTVLYVAAELAAECGDRFVSSVG